MPLVDWISLVAQFRGREASALKVSATVLRTQGEAPARLRELAEKHDFAALAMLAHSLKGMGGNLMAARIFELGRDLDEAARHGDALAIALAEQLAQAMEMVLQELGERLAASQTDSSDHA